MRDLVEEAAMRFSPEFENPYEINSLLYPQHKDRLKAALNFISREAAPLLDELEHSVREEEAEMPSKKQIEASVAIYKADIEKCNEQVEELRKMPEKVAEAKANEEYEHAVAGYAKTKKHFYDRYIKADRVVQIAAPRAIAALDEIVPSTELGMMIVEKITISLRKKLIADFRKASADYVEFASKEPQPLTAEEWREKEIKKVQDKIELDRGAIANAGKMLQSAPYQDSGYHAIQLDLISRTRKDFAVK